MDVAMARERLVQFQQFIKEYLVDGEDFGTIPGTPKPTLYKPGADKLCELYGLADDYTVTQRTEEFAQGLFDYEVKCSLTSKAAGFLVSTGLGSCNSYEKKYRWRDSKRTCPNCGKESIIKGKEEYGGGWVCWAKNGDCCKAKFADNDQSILSQSIGRVQNEDIADLKNTILKMAKKRAKVDATLSATRSSGVFTQDIEDWDIPKAASNPPVEGAISHPPAGASAATRDTQTSTRPPSTSQQAEQAQGAPTKRVPPNGMRATIKTVKYFPAQEKPKLNAMVNVALAEPLTGNNQGMEWKCEFAGCFHGSLLQLLRDSVGKECYFAIKERDRKLNVSDEWPTHFIDIEDVISITDVATGEYHEYVDGKPVLEGDEK
jgi:hypothetical protein